MLAKESQKVAVGESAAGLYPLSGILLLFVSIGYFVSLLGGLLILRYYCLSYYLTRSLSRTES